MSPILFLADFALASDAKAKGLAAPKMSAALQASLMQSPLRALRSSSVPLTPALSSPKSFKSAKSAGSSAKRSGSRFSSGKSSSGSKSAISSMTKKSLIERGACEKHFSGLAGKPSKKCLNDGLNCINGKCGSETPAEVPTEVPTETLAELVPIKKAATTKAPKTPMTAAIKKADLSRRAKIALAEVIVQKARLAVSEAKAALAVAEEDLEKIIMN